MKSAQKAALDAAVLQNATGASIDAAARSVIEDLGTRPEEKHGFSHRLGKFIFHDSVPMNGIDRAPDQQATGLAWKVMNHLSWLDRTINLSCLETPFRTNQAFIS